MKVFFSVIIPALNEELFIPRLLDALSRQTFKDFEVILVDADSTDKTVEITKDYKKKLPLTVVTNTHKNISRSRNMGASKSTAPYLVFIDADNYISATFLENMYKLVGKGYEMILPEVRPDSEKFFYKILYSGVNIFVNAAKKVHRPFSTGGNFVIKREVFNKLKGFDESVFVSEDHEIVNRANKMKVNIAVTNHKVIFSVRRFEKEGFGVLVKYFISTLYVAFFGKITKKIYNYQMGGDYYLKKK